MMTAADLKLRRMGKGYVKWTVSEVIIIIIIIISSSSSSSIGT